VCSGDFDGDAVKWLEAAERVVKCSRILERDEPELPLFIPIVDVLDEVSWVWRFVDVEAVVVKLEPFLESEELVRRFAEIKDRFDFDGKILLSSVIPDRFIEEFSVERYLEIAKQLDVDGMFVPDDYTYLDDPYVVSWRNVFRVVGRAGELINRLSGEVHLVGLVKGANRKQVTWCVKSQLDLGLRWFAFPVRGIPLNILRHLLEEVLKVFEKTGEKVRLIIYGISPHRLWALKGTVKFLEWVKVSIATMSWLLYARDNQAFWKGRFWQLPLEPLYMCNCKFCRGRDLLELVESRSALALHNLVEMRREAERVLAELRS